jgi:hypothetical protein
MRCVGGMSTEVLGFYFKNKYIGYSVSAFFFGHIHASELALEYILLADYIVYFSLTWSCILFIFIFQSAVSVVSVQLQWQHHKESRPENNVVKIWSCHVGLYYSTI